MKTLLLVAVLAVTTRAHFREGREFGPRYSGKKISEKIGTPRDEFLKAYQHFVQEKEIFSLGVDEEITPPQYDKGPQAAWAEPDAYGNVTWLIVDKGYGCEEHTAITKDGFELSIQRIIPPAGVTRDLSVVVVLQHGLLDASSTWVVNQANNSLGFMLANKGWDVWMPNSRGNRYSDSNTHINPWRNSFWDWTWSEMAEYDLPACIDYITAATNVTQVYYVGHSEGTLIAFTQFAKDQGLAAKIKRFSALAPVGRVGHVEGPVALVAPLHGIIYFWLNLVGNEDILPSTPWSRSFGRDYCDVSGFTCEWATMLVCGPDWAGFNESRADVYFSHFPSGTSLKNLNHWAQMIESDKLRKYDYGWFLNPFYYNGKHYPPKYDLTTLKVPTALYSGSNDYLADPKDVDWLRTQISDAIVYDKVLDQFNHLDFVWGMTAADNVYADIISQIETTM